MMFRSDNRLISSENEDEIAPQGEDVSALNDVGQRVKHARIVSDWQWTKVGDNNYFAQKIPFSGNPGAQHQTHNLNCSLTMN